MAVLSILSSEKGFGIFRLFPFRRIFAALSVESMRLPKFGGQNHARAQIYKQFNNVGAGSMPIGNFQITNHPNF